MSNSCNPMNCSPPGSSLSPWDSPGKNTELGCYFLFQRIFLTQGSNLDLRYCRQILCQLSYQGSPWGHYAKSYKSDKERQTPYDLIYMWNILKKGNSLIQKTDWCLPEVRFVCVAGVQSGWRKSKVTNFQL